MLQTISLADMPAGGSPNRIPVNADGVPVVALQSGSTAGGGGGALVRMGAGVIDPATQRITIATDDLILARLPEAVTPGLLPVDTLAKPTLSRVLATSSAPAQVALTPTCRRVSMYATQGAWYSISGSAATAGAAGGASSATAHYIAAGERLDIDVPANTTVSVLRETTDGQLRISELE